MSTAATSTLEKTQAITLGHLPLEPALRKAPVSSRLEAIRSEALDRFNALGLPTTKNEAWKYTSLRPLLQTPLRLPGEQSPSLSVDAVETVRIEGLSGPLLVFINGRFAQEHSMIGTLPQGVQVLRFSEASKRAPEILEAHLARHATIQDEALSALNTALFDDGVLVHVGRNIVLDEPIHVLNLVSTPDAALIMHPRLLVVADEGAEGTVIEEYVGLGENELYFTNALTEIVVASDADVRHYLIERESTAATNISTLVVRQERDSRFVSHSVLLGGQTVRNNVNPILAGENCHSVLNGIYVGRGNQHLDNHMRVEHRMPNCDSRQYYRGILGDESHGVFTGRIVVSQDAQKTDAVQSNQNLLLSDRAQAQTRPQLEIYADDVKCTHGATIGELDEDALFYLRSRGVSEDEARRILIFAFASESLDRMMVEPIRQAVEGWLSDRLAVGDSAAR